MEELEDFEMEELEQEQFEYLEWSWESFENLY
jgi:hypothetical protein